MKKTLAFILTLAMALTMAVPAFAAEGDFVASPGKNDPTIEDSKNENEDCTADVVITPWPGEDLDEDDKKELEDAYEDIAKETDEWKKILEDLAEQLGVDPDDLGVLDIFDLDYANCDDHGEHGAFTLTINVDDLDNFAGLVQYLDGKWQFVLGATAADGRVQFTVSQLSPVAIVVKGDGVKAPQTDDSLVWICAAMMASSLIGLAVIVPGFAKKER